MLSFNRFLDRLSDYLSQRKGLLPLMGVLFVAINFVVRLCLGGSWLAESDLFLHFGVILAILGFLVAWAL
ncbi:MAG: hypothetical protein H8E28_01015 [Anaerolineae bacterium]|nr:hypothetical protein [Anaerolineae bacterium]